MVTGDTDLNGALDYGEVDECVRCAFTREMLEQQLYLAEWRNEGRPNDPPLRVKFDSMDYTGDGYLRFSDFYEHCREGAFFSGLLKPADSDRVVKDDNLKMQQSGNENAIDISIDKQNLKTKPDAPDYSGWQAEMGQHEEARRREWAEAQRRSQDAARRVALAAQEAEPPGSTPNRAQTALGRTLALVNLEQYEAGMYAQGYVAVDDLFDADAQVCHAVCSP